MKHILPILTLALAGAAMTASAATTYDHTFNYGTYEVNTIEYTNQYNQGGWGDYYTIKVNGGGSLYVVDVLNNIQSLTQTETLKAEGIQQYGYYFVNKPGDTTLHSFDISDTTRVKDFDSYTVRQWDNYGHYEDITYYRQGYLLGEFNDGDEIQIWMSDGTSGVASFTPVQSQYSSRFNRGDKTDALNPSMPVAQLHFYARPDRNQVNFGIITAASEGGGDGGGTAGAPLPGGTALYVVAGLFALGFIVARRRKEIAA
ncbi:MAG: hypothetical protein PUC15_00440 [Lentisphaeria bacterium]|nr:hypothetical protein [Lentisphaeria bacterium]